MFCLAARLAGIMAAIRESAVRQHINPNSVSGTKLISSGTGEELPGYMYVGLMTLMRAQVHE